MNDLLKVVLTFVLFVIGMFLIQAARDQYMQKKLICVGPYCLTESR